MRKITQTIVGTTPPLDKNVIWLDSTNSTAPVEKVFINGQWTPTGVGTDDYYTKDEVDDKLDDKLNVIESPVNGNLLAMNSQGQSTDSGKKISDFIANPEIAGQNGEVLSVDSEGNPIWTTVTPTGTADDEMSDTSTNAVQNKVIKSYIDDNCARKNGYYEQMGVGVADNLVGHGTVSAEFNFRTSGGSEDIGTGTAPIDKIKGKTLEWNQQVQLPVSTFTQNNVVIDNSNKVTHTSLGNGVQSYMVYYSQSVDVNIVVGHVYYISAYLDLNYNGGGAVPVGIAFGGSTTANGRLNSSRITESGRASGVRTATYNAETPKTIYFDWTSADAGNIVSGATFTASNIICIDLTLMFEAGNEPSTVAEFEALYPLNYYNYTSTPVLINNAASGIKTTGFNQYNKSVGVADSYLDANGDVQSSTRIDITDYIKVFPSTNYYFKDIVVSNSVSPSICWYDNNKTFISSASGTAGINNKIIQSPSNARYIRLSVYKSLTDSACMNLSWSGYRNGEYEPYEEHTLYFNGESGSLATLTGRLLVNGEPTGESVPIFDNIGMKSVGSVYDFGKADSDGYIRRVMKRLAVVDGGSLSWNKTTYYGTGFSCNTLSKLAKKSPAAIRCAKYMTGTTDDRNLVIEASYSKWGTPNAILQIRDDDAYATMSTTQFATSMNGVPIYYELETPEEYLLDNPIPANYYVNDFGTEAKLPADTASSVSAPLCMDVKYAMNSVDTLRRLGINYIKKESMDHILTAFKTAGIITDYTLTYDATNDNYTCSIEAPTTPGE